jgi:nucleoside-diphosphate-sugar epimerase
VLFEGHFKRNFIHVRDVTRAFIHGLANFELMRDQSFNVGLSDANLSKIELCERIRGQIPDFVYMEAAVGEDPDKRNYIVSNGKIEATGFAPQTSLDAGIRELEKGYRMLHRSQFTNV